MIHYVRLYYCADFMTFYVLLVEEMEAEEELFYNTMPDQLRDKFVPLYFVPICTKELVESET